MTLQPTPESVCPSCGGDIPADAPRGYCLKCLFALGTDADSIVIDETDTTARRVIFQPFVGVAPRRYDALFVMKRNRKREDDGAVIKWRSDRTVVLRMETSSLLYVTNEAEKLVELETLIKKNSKQLKMRMSRKRKGWGI